MDAEIEEEKARLRQLFKEKVTMKLAEEGYLDCSKQRMIANIERQAGEILYELLHKA